MKKIILLFLLSSISSILNAQPKREIRAVWLTTIGGLDWPKTKAQSHQSTEKQKQELREILDKLQNANINTILFQTRIRGTVIYPSAFEPFDSSITGFNGRKPEYDPLEFAVQECHKRGMELHAWVVCMPLGDVKRKRNMGKTFVANANPKICKVYDGQLYLNPASSEARQHLKKICAEICSNYDIDGIHLDYIRYPDRPSSYPDDAEYRKQGRSLSKSEWRRNNITETVKVIRNGIKEIKPWIKLSCSPIGKFDNLPRQNARGWCSYTTVYQDAQGWLREGLMDELYPMMYFQNENFYPFAYDWKENSYGRNIVSGLGIYMLHPYEKNWDINTIKREMYVTRDIGIGHAMFRSKFFTDDTKGIYYLSKKIYSTKSIRPATTWIDSIAPSAPQYIRTDKENLFWGESTDNMQKAGITYNIYASNSYPVDTEDSQNLIAVSVRNHEWTIPTRCKNMNFAVRAMDRSGNESEPIATPQKCKVTNINSPTLLKIDNGKINITNCKSPLLRIIDAKGLVIKVVTNTGEINCKPLTSGIYILQTYEKKDKTRILGYFVI